MSLKSFNSAIAVTLCILPRRRGWIPLLETPLDDAWPCEKRLPKTVTNRQPVQSEQRSPHSHFMIWRQHIHLNDQHALSFGESDRGLRAGAIPQAIRGGLGLDESGAEHTWPFCF
jgi:hypothetical protein